MKDDKNIPVTMDVAPNPDRMTDTQSMKSIELASSSTQAPNIFNPQRTTQRIDIPRLQGVRNRKDPTKSDTPTTPSKSPFNSPGRIIRRKKRATHTTDITCSKSSCK